MNRNDHSLTDQLFTKGNVISACTKVRQNKGGPGVDRMTVNEASKYVQEHIDSIQDQIMNKRYSPTPVRRKWIPKDDGKMRGLGIPTAKDRIILQMVNQVLNPIYDPTFSDSSFGFRPGRSCHDAIRRCISYLNAGYEWVVDIDLEKFFDQVNQDRLISTLLKKVKSGEIGSLVRRFLKAGIVDGTTLFNTDEGICQGSPLSPLLANIVLDELDKVLEKRGLKFCRYADDLIIFVKSEAAANRVMISTSRYIEQRMKLKVNMTKSKVCRADKDIKYLGFTFRKDAKGWYVKPHKKSVRKLANNLKEVTSRKSPLSMDERMELIHKKVQGWINYFRIGRIPRTLLKEVDRHLRFRIRVIIWKQWKTIRKRRAGLEKLARLLKRKDLMAKAHSYANARQGYTRCAVTFLNKYIQNKFLDILGLTNVESDYEVSRMLYLKKRYPQLTEGRIMELI